MIYIASVVVYLATCFGSYRLFRAAWLCSFDLHQRDASHFMLLSVGGPASLLAGALVYWVEHDARAGRGKGNRLIAKRKGS